MRSQCPAPIWTTASASRSGELAGPHAGAGEQLDDQPVAGVGAGPGGCHQPGGVAVVEELGQRLGAWRDVAADDRVAGRRVGPVPLDDPLEERPQRPQPLPVRLLRDRLAARAGLGGQPDLEVLDVIAADLGDPTRCSCVGEHPAGELAQRVLGGVHAARCQERGRLLQVRRMVTAVTCGAAARICSHSRGGDAPGTARLVAGYDARAARSSDCRFLPASDLGDGGLVSASISSAARWY